MRKKWDLDIHNRETRFYFRAERDRLRDATRYCRADMHEPDEQGIVKVKLRGNHLDNAMGSNNPENSHGEYTLGIKRDGEYVWFNLSNLLALARKASI